MRVVIPDKKLSRLADDYQKCCRKMGPLRAKLFIQRLNILKDANTLEDVRDVPGKFHELAGERKGHWACNLDQPYRLIFRPLESPIPVNQDGQYQWNKIEGIEIIEITDYH